MVTARFKFSQSLDVHNLCIFIQGTQGVTYEAGIEDENEEDSIDLQSDVSFNKLKTCEFNIMYAHPEALQRTKFSRLLRTQIYQRQVCAVAVDEAHMISEWYILLF